MPIPPDQFDDHPVALPANPRKRRLIDGTVAAGVAAMLLGASAIAHFAEAASSSQDDAANIPRQPDPTYAAGQTPGSSPDMIAFEAKLAEMLEAGWTTKGTGLKLAGDLCKAAKELRPDDPRLNYAYGLILLKHQQYDDALKQFDSVGKQGAVPYLPALRAAIWLRVLRHSYEPALVDLPDLTRAWQQFEPKSLPAWVNQDYVTWIGRMMGYLDGPVDAKSVDALIEQVDTEILSLLSADYRDLYKKAKMDVVDSYAAKASAQEQGRMQTKKQQEKERDEAKAKLAEEKAQLTEEKKQTDKSADDQEKSLKTQLAEYDGQIAGLDREYNRLDSRVRTFASNIIALDQDIVKLNAQRSQAMSGGNAKSTPGKSVKQPDNTLANSIQVAIEAKKRERQNAQVEHDRLDPQMREIQRQGTVLNAKRQAAINEYQTSTGRLFKDSKSLAAKTQSLKREEQKVSKAATGANTQVRVAAQAVTALKTYLDLPLEIEKQRLLATFAKP